jgi:hypothetical protein
MTEEEKKIVWERYKSDWDNGRSPDMDPDTFDELFYNSGISREAVKLIKTSKFARRTLNETIEPIYDTLYRVINYSDRFRVFFELQGEEEIDRIILDSRTMVASISSRKSLIRNIVERCIAYFGREWVRIRVFRWWREANFLEEEKEGVLKELAEGNVLNWGFLSQLGPDALETVHRLIRRGDIRPEKIAGFRAEAIRSIRGSQPANWLSARIGSLLQQVTIPADIRDSGLRFDELNHFGDSYWNIDKTLFRKAMKSLRHFKSEYLEEFEDVLNQFGPDILRPSTEAKSNNSISFPLIRFLHLQLILEAPSLSSALDNPEVFLAPEIMMTILGRDAVTYSPELRVLRDTDRRWRARWVETAGEALSVLFLESAVNLELASLSRIPEQNNKPTPDFRSQTIGKEWIVFESKGSTNLEKHKAQRNKALIQLGKMTPGSAKGKKNKISWSGSGRAFALSLFAALQGDDDSSLFHVEDPVFMFENLFSKGWQEEAQRSHYTAILEAAQLFEMADNLYHSRKTKELMQEVHTFRIDDNDNKKKETPRFKGTFLPVKEVARRLRHPRLHDIDSLRIFVGVDERIFNNLRRNELPVGREEKESELDEKREVPPPTIPEWGLLPGRKPAGPPRGVYSILSDGAFLAVELR